jgi:transposase
MMQVSKSGYYAWLKRPESKRSQQNKQLVKKIQQIHKESGCSYGSPEWNSLVKVEEWKRVYLNTQTILTMPTKKTYTREFKEQAVQLAQKNGNISETAQNLGLHDSILRRWKMELEQNAEKAFPGKGYSQDEELRQLQRENQRLKETVS